MRRRLGKIRSTATRVLAEYRKLTKFQQRFILGVIAFLVLWTALRLSVAPVLGHELIAQVESQLHARLRVGGFSYHFPYGLTARNCELSLIEPGGKAHELLEVKELSVTLADLPLFGGPLIVEEITVSEPAVHIVRTAAGFAGQSGLLRQDNQKSAAASKPSSKLSDILRLHHVEIQDARIVYEDLTRPARPQTTWNGLDLVIDTSPRGPADYAFNIYAHNGKLVDMKASGTFNVDEFSTKLKDFAVDVRAGAQAQQLPPQLQAILQRYRVRGELKIAGSASAGLEAGQNSCAATITLTDASAYSPEADAALDDLHLTVNINGGAQATSLRLTHCSARAANVIFNVNDGGVLEFDWVKQSWSLSKLVAVLGAAQDRIAGRATGLRRFNPKGSIELTAALQGPIEAPMDWSKVKGEALIYPRRISIQPAGFGAPVSNIDGGPIRLSKGVLVIRDLQARYGTDQLLVSSVRVVLPQGQTNAIRCSDLSGSLILRLGGPPLPGLAGPGAPQVQAAGEYVFSGRASINRNSSGPPMDCDLFLSCDKGRLAVASPRMDVSQIKFDIEAFADRVDLLELKCQTFGGTVTARGEIASQPPFAFVGTLFTKSLSLPQIVAAIQKPSANGLKLQGLVDIAATISGQAQPAGKSPADTLHSEGQLELLQGDLWDIPALQKIENSTDIARKALTIGQAAALFRIANDKIELRDAAVSAPVLGVQGSGTIGFDGQLDLHVVAAPLADWKQKMRWLGGSAADFFGDAQKMLNKASSKLLYEFVVSGPASDPILRTVTVPVLRDKAAAAMKNMMQQSETDRPINILQNQSK